MFGFSSKLRSETQGKGEFSMEFSRYAPADSSTSQKIIDEYMEAQEEALKRRSK